MSVKISVGNMRLPDGDKNFYLNQFQIFADTIAETVKETIVRVAFAKQDSRGSLSITLFDDRHCVPMQRHFSSKDELLGFVVGYNLAKRNVEWI